MAVVRTNATIRLTPCRTAEKGRLLISRLDGAKPAGAELFRVRDAETGLRLLQALRKHDREAKMLSARQTEPERLQASAWFAAAERPALVIADGLDLPETRSDVRRLFVMNLPPSLAAAEADLLAVGRDGLDASAEFFASEGDRRRLAADNEARFADPERRERLDLVNLSVAWVEHDGCARVFLARHVRGETIGVCGNCGWCLGKRGAFLPPE